MGITDRPNSDPESNHDHQASPNASVGICRSLNNGGSCIDRLGDSHFPKEKIVGVNAYLVLTKSTL